MSLNTLLIAQPQLQSHYVLYWKPMKYFRMSKMVRYLLSIGLAIRFIISRFRLSQIRLQTHTNHRGGNLMTMVLLSTALHLDVLMRPFQTHCVFGIRIIPTTMAITALTSRMYPILKGLI